MLSEGFDRPLQYFNLFLVHFGPVFDNIYNIFKNNISNFVKD